MKRGSKNMPIYVGRTKRNRTDMARTRYIVSNAPRLRRGEYVPTSARAVEKKGMDTEIDIAFGSVLATTSTNGSSSVINLIRQGAGSWNRIGRKVKLSSVRVKGIAEFSLDNEATTDAIYASTLRMVLVWDKQPSGDTQPAFDEIFGRTTQDGTESTEYMDNLRYDNTGRFSVLRDVVKTINPALDNTNGGSTDVVRMQCTFDEYVKLQGRESIYSGQSSPMTIADISTGALYVYFRADRNSSGQQWAIQNATARLRYYD